MNRREFLEVASYSVLFSILGVPKSITSISMTKDVSVAKNIPVSKSALTAVFVGKDSKDLKIVSDVKFFNLDGKEMIAKWDINQVIRILNFNIYNKGRLVYQKFVVNMNVYPGDTLTLCMPKERYAEMIELDML